MCSCILFIYVDAGKNLVFSVFFVTVSCVTYMSVCSFFVCLHALCVKCLQFCRTLVRERPVTVVVFCSISVPVAVHSQVKYCLSLIMAENNQKMFGGLLPML